MELDVEGRFESEGATAGAIRRAAKWTVVDVGGGAGTATVLTRGMVDEGLRWIKKGTTNLKDLERGMQKAVDAVLASLTAQSRTIDDPERLAQILAARENLEPRLAGLLATAVKTVPPGAVQIIESPGAETDLQISPVADEATIILGGINVGQRAAVLQRALHVADAIYRGGAVAGGGVAYLRASKALDELEPEGGEIAGVEIVRKALREPARTIIEKISGVQDPMSFVRRIERAKGHKGLNIINRKFEDLVSAGVVDPTVVACAAVKNAAGAASNVILSSGKSKGPPPRVPPTATGDSPSPSSATATVVRYTQVTCVRRVSLREKSFTVLAGLTLAPTSSESMPARVDPSIAVAVRLTGSAGLKVLGNPSAELVVLADRDSTPAPFDVRPLASGWHILRVLYSQSGHPVAEVALTVNVVDRDVDEEPLSTSTPIVAPGTARPPDFRLYITYADSMLTFELQRDSEPLATFPPITLQSSLESFMQAKYDQLDQTRRGVDPAVVDVRGRMRKLDANDVDERVRTLGRVLWNDLVPRDMRLLYAEQRDEWRDKGFMILSNEPFVPWELILPFDGEGKSGWEDTGPWCETLALTRWLRPEPPDSDAVAGAAPVDLPLARMSILAPAPPVDQPLPAAAGEKEFLERFQAIHRISPAGVEPATRKNVMARLREGTYDWLHAVTHGTADGGPTGHAALWLEGDDSIVPDDFVDPKVVKALVEQRPAFVLNACEVGRESWSLRGTSGWATRLVGKGAGLLIAPLWAVTDELASKFVTVLYEELVAGALLGRAVRTARNAARKEGDPTWLAYSVYGHPHATLRTEVTNG